MKVIMAYQGGLGQEEDLFCALRKVDLPLIGTKILDEDDHTWVVYEVWHFLGIDTPVLDVRTPGPDNYRAEASFGNLWEIHKTMWMLYFRDKVRAKIEAENRQ